MIVIHITNVLFFIYHIKQHLRKKITAYEETNDRHTV